MHTPTLHSVLILMNVSRLNSHPLRHAVLIFQPVNRISYFLSAFSLLHFTIMLHSIFESHFPKNHRQMMEQSPPQQKPNCWSSFLQNSIQHKPSMEHSSHYKSLKLPRFTLCVIGFKSQYNTNATQTTLQHAYTPTRTMPDTAFFLYFLTSTTLK